MVLEAVLGLGIGALLGLLGAGGSILAVPALVYGAGQPLSAAVPTSLLVVGASSAAAVLPRVRAGQVRWRIAAVVGATGAATAFPGAELNRALGPRLVLAGFALLMAAAGVRLLRGTPGARGGCAGPDGHVQWRACLPRSVAVGAAVGLLTGLFGVGGGFLLVPALTVILGLPLPAAAGTSLVVVAVNAVAGLAAHARDIARLQPSTALVFTAAAVTASLVAARASTRLPADRLRRWFAYLVLSVAAYVAVRAAVS